MVKVEAARIDRLARFPPQTKKRRMIAADPVSAHNAPVPGASPLPWKLQWRAALRDARALLEFLGLGRQAAALGVDMDSPFPLRVPLSFARRMRQGDPHDPLLMQVLARTAEALDVPGFVADPVGDAAARPVPGLLHKYRGRALLILTGSCAVHCRYCFRRHYDYAHAALSPAALDAALDYLAADTSIHEVLLSGGDPLSLDTPKLQHLSDRLARIPQIRRLRIHTRLPVVLPARVDRALTDWLGGLPWPVAVVIHVNHAQEVDGEVAAALARLKPVTQALLNQTVLLRGVNDSAEDLVGLSERLYASGVLPYYLNVLDAVAGAAHFSVPDATALSLLEALRQHLPGYLVPRLVREVAGEGYKRPLA